MREIPCDAIQYSVNKLPHVGVTHHGQRVRRHVQPTVRPHQGDQQGVEIVGEAHRDAAQHQACVVQEESVKKELERRNLGPDPEKREHRLSDE